jgi:HEPN domain-containing protein
MNARPQAWLAQARNDLDLAELACRNGFLAQACDYASQAADKALKSALLELGLEPPHIRVLGDLLQRLQAAGLETAALQTLPLKALRRMGITSRCPAMPPRQPSCLTAMKLIRPLRLQRP